VTSFILAMDGPPGLKIVYISTRMQVDKFHCEVLYSSLSYYSRVLRIRTPMAKHQQSHAIKNTIHTTRTCSCSKASPNE
jgi:hypothetical protein